VLDLLNQSGPTFWLGQPEYRAYIQGGPQKSKPLQNDQKIVLNLSMRLDLVVKLKHKSCTIILFVGIRYSMLDQLSDP